MPVLLPVLAAAAAITSVNIPQTIGKDNIATAKSSSQIAVLMPQTLKTSLKKIHPQTIADPGSYKFYLDATRNCYGAGACGDFTFIGRDKGKARGRQKVDLARGRTGRFTPSACGASCSSPRLQWRERDNLYSVEFKEGVKDDVIELANQAIRKGPR